MSGQNPRHTAMVLAMLAACGGGSEPSQDLGMSSTVSEAAPSEAGGTTVTARAGRSGAGAPAAAGGMTGNTRRARQRAAEETRPQRTAPQQAAEETRPQRATLQRAAAETRPLRATQPRRARARSSSPR
jgi:hypothetical protein